jgi:tripartite-type tricarboxylate transporter receptor subunit TctC
MTTFIARPRAASGKWSATFASLALGTTLASGYTAAHADYPDKPITIIVGYTAGGANDVLARIYAEKLQGALKQTVIVENRPGVASIIGAGYVARAKPDGYTLLMGASGPIAFNYALYIKLPYKQQDFAPISLIGTFPLVLLTESSNPAKNVKDLVAYSTQHPDKANYSASAASFQLMTELFKEKTGAKFAHVPYKGSAESITAVMSGEVAMTLVDSGPATTALTSGRVKALAVTSAERMKSLPDVPTLKELGIDLTVTLWSGLLAPAGTPPEIIKRLQDEIAIAAQSPDVKSKLAALAIAPAYDTPAEFDQLITGEIKQWTEVARQSGVPPQ